MLGEKPRHTGNPRASRHLVDRRTSLAQRDGLIVALQRGQQIAKAPHSAQVDSILRKPPLPPRLLEFFGAGTVAARPCGIRDLQQVSALRTAEILAGGFADIAATDAAKAVTRNLHIRR